MINTRSDLLRRAGAGSSAAADTGPDLGDGGFFISLS